MHGMQRRRENQEALASTGYEGWTTSPSQPDSHGLWRAGTRFELATTALARRCSTTELLPLVCISAAFDRCLGRVGF